jgi:hypothetical protein
VNPTGDTETRSRRLMGARLMEARGASLKQNDFIVGECTVTRERPQVESKLRIRRRS